QNIKRESGRKVQTGNINAAKKVMMCVFQTIADVIRTCLGPRAMMKMLLDPMGGIVMTNDGNAILREIQVQHPAAKSMIEISRTQDEEVGDGTTSVIILAGELLSVAEQFLEQQMHPTVIISAYRRALDDMLESLKEISTPVDTSDRSMMLKIIHSAINTKVLSRWSELACSIALDAVRTVELEDNGRKEIDIKKYAKVEKVPGGIIEDSCVLRGVMVNKDVTHPRMRRLIREPRIVLLDCSLEYKKGEKISKEEDFARILQMEEEYIQQICEDIIRLKPDLVFTEKGISGLSLTHTHARSRACRSLVSCWYTSVGCPRSGAALPDEGQHHRHPPCQEDGQQPHRQGVWSSHRQPHRRTARGLRGHGGGAVRGEEDRRRVFHLRHRVQRAQSLHHPAERSQQGDPSCEERSGAPLLSAPSQPSSVSALVSPVQEVERNLQDAMQVCRNVLLDPHLLLGGGAVEMAVSKRLMERSRALTGIEQWPYRAVAQALEVIPRTLIQNCGASTIRVLTSLRAKHTQDNGVCWGVDGESGCLSDMSALGIWEPLAVKAQTYKTAVETAILLLRIDDIVSGHKKKDKDGQMGGQ
ncbi:unnamed protein product, partial [Tetraodon nigroviridis]